MQLPILTLLDFGLAFLPFILQMQPEGSHIRADIIMSVSYSKPFDVVVGLFIFSLLEITLSSLHGYRALPSASFFNLTLPL